MNVKILVCCHKKDVCVAQEPYLPIHVGHALHPDANLGIQCDDDGENISLKNGSYCELTGMYWAWKNLKNVDIIGLNHYRRYFDFHGVAGLGVPETQIKSQNFERYNFEIPKKILNEVQKGAYIVAKPRTYSKDVFSDYCCSHYSSDIKIVRDIIREFENKYLDAFDYVMNSCQLIHYNMFIVNWQNFDEYCQWLFKILNIAERKIDISNYDVNQKRVFGYLAERLFNVYMYANKKNVKKYPILWFFDDDYPKYSVLKNAIRNARNNIINLMSHPRRFLGMRETI